MDSSGNWVRNACTKYYALCTERKIQTAPIEMNDPDLTSCRNDVIVAASTCTLPVDTCVNREVECTDQQGVATTGTCTSYYRECDAGTFGEVMPVAAGSKCLNGDFVLNTDCASASCTFTNIQCTNGAGAFVNTYCTGYFVQCDDGTLTDPIAVPEGTQCYQNELVIQGTCADPVCSFEGIRCATADGVIVADHCTNYFVMCSGGEVTEPRVTAPGTKCYNHEQVLSSACSAVDCSFTGKICVNSCGDFVTNQCTSQYAECVDSKEVIRTVASGEACYNSQIVADSDAKCTVTVEVTESKTKGIRGRK